MFFHKKVLKLMTKMFVGCLLLHVENPLDERYQTIKVSTCACLSFAEECAIVSVCHFRMPRSVGLRVVVVVVTVVPGICIQLVRISIMIISIQTQLQSIIGV